MPSRPRHTTIEQNFRALQESVYFELKSSQDRVRNIIGDRHWQTDGEHKEEVLRNAFRSRLPEVFRIGKGFVCVPAEEEISEYKSTGQIDILVTSAHHLTLYKQGELVFVTPNAAHGIIEVKTELRGLQQKHFTALHQNASHTRKLRSKNNKSNILAVIKRLADQIQIIRANGNDQCWAGLFVYETGATTHQKILRALQIAAQGNEQRAVNCVAVGSSIFVHYWANGRDDVDSPIKGAVWHSYEIPRLAPAYFVNNLAMHLSPETPYTAQHAWFPVEGGKETRRTCYAALHGTSVRNF